MKKTEHVRVCIFTSCIVSDARLCCPKAPRWVRVRKKKAKARTHQHTRRNTSQPAEPWAMPRSTTTPLWVCKPERHVCIFTHLYYCATCPPEHTGILPLPVHMNTPVLVLPVLLNTLVITCLPELLLPVHLNTPVPVACPPKHTWYYYLSTWTHLYYCYLSTWTHLFLLPIHLNTPVTVTCPPEYTGITVLPEWAWL